MAYNPVGTMSNEEALKDKTEIEIQKEILIELKGIRRELEQIGKK